MFKRNSIIIRSESIDTHVDRPEYVEFCYSLFAHANLYRTAIFEFDYILRQEYDKND